MKVPIPTDTEVDIDDGTSSLAVVNGECFGGDGHGVTLNAMTIEVDLLDSSMMLIYPNCSARLSHLMWRGIPASKRQWYMNKNRTHVSWMS